MDNAGFNGPAHADQQTDVPGGDAAIAHIIARADAGDMKGALALALELWKTGTPAQRAWAGFRLPNVLAHVDRKDEALQVYAEAVAQGFAVGDFRIRSTTSSLARSDPDLAERLYRRDRDAFGAALEAFEAGARVWTPRADPWGVIDLRGATILAGEPFEAVFELHLAGHPRLVKAVAVQRATNVVHWHATVDDVLPGQEMTIRLLAGGMASSPLLFTLPAVVDGQTQTRPGDVVGLGGAVFAGKAVHGSTAARYRFEYSEGATLDRATPWRRFPPPRTARAYKPLYRQSGEWMPTCVHARWIHRETTSGELADPGFALGAPFTKDRNQLTGIGAHEMVVGFTWPRAGGCSWGLGGSELDLRDAEITFTVAGDSLDQKGYALHFWASHASVDAVGPFTSQWALTAAPFPDAALADREPGRVTFRLRSDPRGWTYTGNNPQEQGSRSDRYRRAPLDATLSEANAGSVLIFSFGDVRRPPDGALVLYGTEVRYRDYSVLSPASQARLVTFPAGGFSDPCALTAGWRGYDDQLWTSGPAPVFPLEFTWELAEITTLTHFHICQHPYWPARDVEITATDGEGVRHILWTGVLNEVRPDRDQPEYVSEPVSGVAAASLTVRILSAYRPERCGLDCVAVFGDGASFMPDGVPSTFSAEVDGLTPGATVQYRFVVEEDGDAQAGAIATIALPVTCAPILEGASPLRRRSSPPGYAVRANAMGLETELWAELDLGNETVAGPRISLGSQPTGRHIYYFPEGLPARPGSLRLRARNAAGETSLSAPWPLE